MCGICGYCGFDDKALLKKMTKAFIHRGPDDFGYFTDKDVGLGHRRLSIIDLGGGHQPMSNEDGSIWIVFNGEIYNYLELKKNLSSRGHRFKTNSDTEAIIHAYEEHGDMCLDKLRGMFAFAIWDSNKKKLFIARDRLGIKPLYYTLIENKLIFASEIKSILEYPINRQVNLTALHEYLSFRYVPAPETMFKNIMKLLPGHSLTYKQGKITIRKYWDLDLSKVSRKSELYYIQKTRQLIEECIKMRLMSDVPLGAFLSGGVDSSSVVGIMSRLMDKPVKTFSVGFGVDGDVDELSYAKLVAEHFGTDHQEITVKEDSAELIPNLVWHMDEPLADSATIPTYLIAKLARKKVTVVLTGEGADEAFAGYDKYYAIPTRNKIKLPQFLRILFGHLERVTPDVWKFKRAFKFASSLGDIEKAYINYMSMFTENEKKSLYSINVEAPPPQQVHSQFFEKSKHQHILNKLLYVDIKTWLPEDLLMKVDKMTMAMSLEARVPFLDHKLMQFALTIPPELKMRGRTSKYILRKSMAGVLPKKIQERKKHGFDVPIHIWFTGDLKDTASDIFQDSKYFNHKKVDHMLYQHQKGIKNNAQRLWILLIFEIWHKIFIEKSMKVK